MFLTKPVVKTKYISFKTRFEFTPQHSISNVSHDVTLCILQNVMAEDNDMPRPLLLLVVYDAAVPSELVYIQ